MKHIVITFVLAVTASSLAAGQSRTKRSAPAPQAVKYHATVDENEAVFTFPLVPTQRYEWCPGGLQYAWTVKIHSENQDFEFGYFMFTAMGASPCGRGNIQKLLREGQFSLYKQNDGSGAMITGVAEGRFVTYEDNFSDEFLSEKTIVSGLASQNQLTIKLSGAKTIQLLFADRPKYLTFESQILEKKKSMNVPVTYASKFPSTRTNSVTGNTAKQAATCMTKEQAGELVKQLVPDHVITYQLSGNLIYQRLSLADMKRYYPVSYLLYERGYLAMQDNGYSVSQPLTPKGQRLVAQYRRDTDVPQEADLPFATKTLVSVDKVTCVGNKMRIDSTYKVQPTQTALDVAGTDIYRVKPFDRPWKVGIEFTHSNGAWNLPKNLNLSPGIE
jgi:hypothetical protein